MKDISDLIKVKKRTKKRSFNRNRISKKEYNDFLKNKKSHYQKNKGMKINKDIKINKDKKINKDNHSDNVSITSTHSSKKIKIQKKPLLASKKVIHKKQSPNKKNYKKDSKKNDIKPVIIHKENPIFSKKITLNRKKKQKKYTKKSKQKRSRKKKSLKEHVKSIKNKSSHQMIEELKSKGITVSGNSNTVLKDIYLYMTMDKNLCVRKE